MDKERQKMMIVRHLPTVYNKNGVNMGRVLDAGIDADEKARADFKNRLVSFTRNLNQKADTTVILSSPARRCLETAEIIKKTVGVVGGIQTMADLNEIDMGKFSKKDAMGLRAEFGLLVEEWMYRPETFRFPEGESYSELRARARNTLAELVDHLRNKQTVYVCTHVDVIKMILSEVLSFSFNQRRYFTIPNGSVSILGLDSEDKLRVEGINIYP